LVNRAGPPERDPPRCRPYSTAPRIDSRIRPWVRYLATFEMKAVRLSCVRSIRGRISKPSRSCQDGFHARKSSSQTRSISRKTRQVLTFAPTFPRTFNPLNDAAGDQSAQTTLSRLPDRVTVLIALSNRGKACSSKKRSAAPAET